MSHRRSAAREERPKIVRRRPGGRTAATTKRVYVAAFAILKECGYGGLTIEAVAKRADVNRVSLYRRWGTKPALVAAALVATAERLVPIPSSGTLRNRLIAFLLQADLRLRSGEGTALLHLATIEARDDPELKKILREFWSIRVAQMESLLRSSAPGELSRIPDPLVFLELLVGPLHVRLLMLSPSPSLKEAAAIVDRALTLGD